MFDDLLKELSTLDQRRLDEVFDMYEASGEDTKITLTESLTSTTADGVIYKAE